jgi:hypothetical protein
MTCLQFDYSSQLKKDSDVESLWSNLPGGAFADFSYNRLTIDSLKLMASFLVSDPTQKCCVRGNDFTFDDFYEVLSGMKAHNLFYERRICMSQTDIEWRIEQLAFNIKVSDALLQSTAELINSHTNTSELRNLPSTKHGDNVEFDSLVESNRIRDERFERLFAKYITAEYGPSNADDGTVSVLSEELLNTADDFIGVVEEVMCKHLLNVGCDMPCQLPVHLLHLPHEAKDQEEIDWDSVIFCKKRGDSLPTVFLVEEIKSVDIGVIHSMQTRINSTRKFIVMCKNTPTESVECSQRKLFSVWAAFNNCTIRGVFGAPAFTDSQVAEIDDSSFMRINYNLSNPRGVDIFERGTKRSEILLEDYGDAKDDSEGKLHQ